MQRIFKTWLIVILILSIIASFLVGIESTIFGLMLLPLILVMSIILILGYLKK